MILRDLISISAGNLRRMRLRTSLTVSGVVIAIAAFVSMVSFGAGNQKYVSEQFDRLGLFNTMQVYPPNKPAGSDTVRTRELDSAALAELARIPGVRLAYPLDAITAIVAMNDSVIAMKVQALPTAAVATKLFSRISAGRAFGDDRAKEAMVTTRFLKSFRIAKPDSAIGKSFVLSVKTSTIDSGLAWLVPRDPERYIRGKLRAMHPDSLLRPRFRYRYVRELADEGISRFLDGFFNHRVTVRDTLEIAGVLSDGGDQTRIEPIIVPIATAMRLRSSGLGGDPSDLFAALSAGNVFSLESAASARAYPRATLDLDPAVPLKSVSDSVKALGFRTFSFAEQFEEMRRFFLYFKLILGVVGLIALATASLGIVNTMVMSILERRREIGVLKSLGADERDIKFLFLVESGVIGAAGSAAGILAGWIISRGASLAARTIMARQGMEAIELFAMPPWLVLIALAIGIGVSLIAGYYPAARAAAVDPVEALRNE
jgi:ABC-type antimicrobial peptide transport system permease subunit